MDRFVWQSYPQYLQNTLFHKEKLEPYRKKTLQERLAQAYEFKAKGDEMIENSKFREAMVQYEYAFGLFKYCEKKGRKITVVDDSKSARELRVEQGKDDSSTDAFTRFWVQVDELLCSLLVQMAVCATRFVSPNGELAVAATTEALEVRPDHAPALYRRSQAQAQMGNHSEAVEDARRAFRSASDADEPVRRHLFLHMRKAEEERRANSLVWGFIGFVYDLPWTIAALPATMYRMPPRRRALVLVFVLLVLGAIFYWCGAPAVARVGRLADAEDGTDGVDAAGADVAEAADDGMAASEDAEPVVRKRLAALGSWWPSALGGGAGERAAAKALDGDSWD